jgi:hypothetical protein
MESLEQIPQKDLLVTVVTQLRFALEVKNIKTILDEKNLGFIILKGPHLGNTIYSNPVERVYCDLDLLVKPKEFFSAIDLLRSNGYEGPLEDPNRVATERAFYCWTLISPSGVSVEIHRDLTGYGRYPINIDKLFERAEVFEIDKIKVRGLGSEDLLLHLCLHMIQDYFRYNGKKHIEDIALLTKKRTVNWDSFVKRVNNARCSSGAYYALLAARTQYSGEIPDNVLQVLSPRGIRKKVLDLHLDPSSFPIYKYSDHKIVEVQMRLGLMLMDRLTDWVPFLWKYSGIRFHDALMRRSVTASKR